VRTALQVAGWLAVYVAVSFAIVAILLAIAWLFDKLAKR
jgi:hypothetical protein